MTIYTVYLSEDGLYNKVFTNVKCMFNSIEKIGYEPIKVEELKYSYANLVKALNDSSKNGTLYKRVDVECENYSSIQIQEMVLVSK